MPNRAGPKLLCRQYSRFQRAPGLSNHDPRSRKIVQIQVISVMTGLSRDVVHTLHKSLAGIALMRMSIELAGIQIERSHRAIRETDELLERVRREGF